MHRVLEAVHRDLTEDGRDLVFEVRREQREAFGRIGDGLEQASEGDRLAEHRRGLRQRERCRLMEHSLPPGEVCMQSVAQLVRECEDVSPARRPVEQEIRMMGGHRVRAERARTLARTRRGVDPGVVEELASGIGELARERAVRVENQFLRLVPADLALGTTDRRHPVVIGDAVHAEQLRLQGVPALRDRVAPLHRVDECLYRLVARFVGEIATGDP